MNRGRMAVEMLENNVSHWDSSTSGNGRGVVKES